MRNIVYVYNYMITSIQNSTDKLLTYQYIYGLDFYFSATIQSNLIQRNKILYHSFFLLILTIILIKINK